MAWGFGDRTVFRDKSAAIAALAFWRSTTGSWFRVSELLRAVAEWEIEVRGGGLPIWNLVQVHDVGLN